MNTDWGFGGTHEAAAWDMAHEKIMAATNCAPYAVAEFLDSRWGRHFADDVSNALLNMDTITLKVDENMANAIDTAIVKWMGWSISVATSKEYGIPMELPYLTGFVGMFEAASD